MYDSYWKINRFFATRYLNIYFVFCFNWCFIFTDIGDNKNMFYVYADESRLSEGTADIITAIEDLFSVHFVHNFMYLKRTSKFLELLQEYFFKIITLKS